LLLPTSSNAATASDVYPPLGDISALFAPIKATCTADAAALAHEAKSLFADVRSCKAAVSQLQVTRGNQAASIME
jgi:hypothetical protein